MKKTTALLMFMVASLALPVGAQTQPAVPNGPAAVQNQAATPEITVDKANGLNAAALEATKKLEAADVKEVIIRITTCERQDFPGKIEAQGKITIVGCGDKPAGIGGDAALDRTVLTIRNTSINSPVEIRGVNFKIPSYEAFTAYDSIKISNSVVEQQSSFGLSSAKFLKLSPSNGAKNAEFVFTNVTFNDTLPFTLGSEGSKVTFKQNVVNAKIRTSGKVLDLVYSKNYTPDGSAPVHIEDNNFTVTDSGSFSSLVEIARGDVTVHNNRFKLTNPDASARAINLYNPRSGLGKELANVKITFNQFDGGTAIANGGGSEKIASPDVVTITNNDFSKAKAVFPIDTNPNSSTNTVSDKANLVAEDNFWGDLDTEKNVKATVTRKLDKYAPPAPPAPPVPPVVPSPPVVPGPVPGPQQPQPQQPQPQQPSPTPTADPSVGPAAPRAVSRLSGETRYETAGKVAETVKVGDAKAVVLARGDVAADSVSAVPFAEEADAPILLTPPNALHPVAEKEIKRLLPNGGTVYVMGGEVAINKNVVDAVTKLGVKVERIAGANRAGTAVATAEKLAAADKVKRVVIASGNDWQADLIAGPAAAEVDGAVLLTNGDQMAPETAAFLAKRTGTSVTTVGADAAKAVPSVEHVLGADGEALSLAVAKRFFNEPKAAGVATTADFADALAGGAMIAEADGPLLLADKGKVDGVRDYLKSQKALSKVFVFGGEERFSTADMDALTK